MSEIIIKSHVTIVEHEDKSATVIVPIWREGIRQDGLIIPKEVMLDAFRKHEEEKAKKK